MKTIESQSKALKSAEKKTKQTLKEVRNGVPNIKTLIYIINNTYINYKILISLGNIDYFIVTNYFYIGSNNNKHQQSQKSILV